MPAVHITQADLAPYAEISEDKANSMIAGALARAPLKAPCITSEDFQHTTAAKAVLIEAILRWNESGGGTVTQNVAGPFQQTIDTTVRRRGLFLHAGAYDTAGHPGNRHITTCRLNTGGQCCSCGATLLP